MPPRTSPARASPGRASPGRASPGRATAAPPPPLDLPAAFVVAENGSDADGADALAHVAPGDLLRLRVNVGERVAAGADVVALWPSASVAAGSVRLPAYARRRLAPGDACTIDRLPAAALAAAPALTLLLLRPVPPSQRLVELARQPLILEQLRSHLRRRCIVAAGSGVDLVLAGRPRQFDTARFETGATRNVAFGIFTERTTLLIDDVAVPAAPSAPLPAATFASVGGLQPQIQAIRDMLLPLVQRSDVYSRFRLRPPRGVLLHGPPGTGKTLLARCVAAELGLPFFSLSVAETVSKYYGETEARIRELFERAAAAAPAVLFIDELDALCPKRDVSVSDLDKRVVATLLTLMDGADPPADSSVIVLAATNRPSALDPALRRPGRFDTELEIGVPSSLERRDILRKLLGAAATVPAADVDAVADACYGYVGADLRALVNEAALLCLRRGLGATPPAIGLEDLRAATARVRPSAMRQIAIEVPDVTWDDIGGQEEVKARLREAVEWPIKHSEAFARLGIRPPKGLLLYGPPGNSKTMMAKALANEAQLNFLAVKGPELFSKWVGESERAVQELFRRARQVAPSIVFLDEIDALAGQRSGGGGGGGGASLVGDRVLSQLLTELDGIEPLVNVVVVAATNRPDLLDPALLRPGRIDRLLHIGLPDVSARHAILARHLRRTPHDLADDAVAALARTLEGYSGAEVAAVCREASLAALEEDVGIAGVGERHFALAVERVRPRTSPDALAFYARFAATREGAVTLL